MKIECDKCGAKYSIADDKVRGKTFKIRCKKCSNVIIVRDKAGGGDAAESEAPADEPGWHLAIGGETVGPLSEQEVREKHAAGEIDRETSVWQEGFEDWLPLGDVAAFSDLADRAAASAAPAAAPDPFAGGGDDDYSSSHRDNNRGGASAFSSPEPARAAPAAASVAAASVAASPATKGESPRVSQLTSARNENSVLFSLDSLSSMAMGSKGSGGGGAAPSSFSAGSGGGGGGGGGGGLSPSASGNSEGSGLIDIRSMGAMLGGGGGGGSGGGGGDDDRDDSMLPSFGGTGFGGLAAAPLLTAAPPVAADAASTPEPQRQNQTPLYILIGILVLGLGGLAAYVVTRPPPQPQEKIVERIVAPPVQPDKNDDDDDDAKARKKKKDEEAEAEAEADAAGEPVGDEKGAATTKPGDKKGTTKPGDKKGTTKPGDKKGDDKPAATGDTPPAKVEPKPKEDDTPSVECILDPSKCKKGGSGGEKTKPPPDASMPEKLELADIKAGVAGPKGSAESNCKKHAKGGEKVKIKLSISGPAGTVISAAAEDDAGNAALGSCVAAELKKATFKKVQKEQIGTVVSVSF